MGRCGCESALACFDFSFLMWNSEEGNEVLILIKFMAWNRRQNVLTSAHFEILIFFPVKMSLLACRHK